MKTFFTTIAVISVFLLSACTSNRRISSKGLPFIQLGESMPAEGLNSLNEHSVKDTLFDEGGYQWRATILEYETGRVWIEEDFLRKGKVNRIRVETPYFQGKKHISVGMSFKELKALKNDWNIFYLSQYGVIDVSSDSKFTIHYLLEDPSYVPDDTEQVLVPLEKVRDDAKIVAIVIMK